jgi:hypothetical protein
MLIQREHFERLLDEPWNAARVDDAIAAIVADAEAAFDPTALWPVHEWDAEILYGSGQPQLKVLYAGAAGVVWALDELRRRGHAAPSLDLPGAAMRALELERAGPDATADEHYRPGSLLDGETGPLLVAFRLTWDGTLADDLHARVLGNVDNPTDDISWGAPGTLLAALTMHEWTAEPRWLEAARESAAALRSRRGEDGLWRQDDDYRGLGTLHGAAGNTLVLLRLEPDDALASGPQPHSPGTRSARTGSPTGRERQAASSRGHETAGSASSGARERPESSPAPGSISTKSSSSPAPSSSGTREPIATRRVTASATAPLATASRCSRRSPAPATRCGSIEPGASLSTPSARRIGWQP